MAARITRRVRTDSVMTLDLMASCCYGSLVGYLNSTGNPPDDTHPSLLPRSRSTYQWPGSYQYWLVSSHQNYCLLQIRHAAGLCHMIGSYLAFFSVDHHDNMCWSCDGGKEEFSDILPSPHHTHTNLSSLVLRTPSPRLFRSSSKPYLIQFTWRTPSIILMNSFPPPFHQHHHHHHHHHPG